MKQVLISGKGEVEVLEVPVPGKLRDSVLVRNAYSLISKGTEGSAVSRSGGWLGAMEKALASRDRLEQVWKMAKTQGPMKTWEIVSRKLGEYLPVGYSCAGVVVETQGDVPFHDGDRVACMGAGFAMHAEYVTVPRHLVARAPDQVSLESAAFGALACIALQGIRRLELTPGETVGVIGLGLIGQIAVQLLQALGYEAIGMDIAEQRAKDCSAINGAPAWALTGTAAVRQTMEATSGRGLDGVLLCAATGSSEPVNLAFDLCRAGGRVSVVGDLGLDLDRARMYKKELELRLSCSYGPGRYDDSYELAGRDYPLRYARWTELRSLQLVLQLEAQGKLQLGKLVSHTFAVDRAVEAYRAATQETSSYGVLIGYDGADGQVRRPESGAAVIRRPSTQTAGQRIRLGILGAGGFAKGVHLPNLERLPDVFQLAAISSRNGATAETLARRFHLPVSSSEHRVLIEDPNLDAVLIATRHASHAALVLAALEAGKHVFVEKPLCLTSEQGREIAARAAATGCIVRVGFNRRFSPYVQALLDAVGRSGARALHCRVNVGPLGQDWSNTLEEGGRLLGEGVHFFDLCNYFLGEYPLAVSAIVSGEPTSLNPNAMIQIAYPGGGMASISYLTGGHTMAGKERFEAIGNGKLAFVDDYVNFGAFGTSVKVAGKHRRDKGHLEELKEFADAVRGIAHSVAGADATAGWMATWMAEATYQSARTGQPVARPEMTAAVAVP